MTQVSDYIVNPIKKVLRVRILRAWHLVIFLGRTSKKNHPVDYSLSYRAVEALRVVVVVDRLHPAVSRLDRETAGDALCCEQFVPI